MISAKQVENILILKNPKETITLNQAKDYKERFENSLNQKFPYVAYTNILGYFAGYDFINNQTIYCGTMSEKTTIEQIKEHIKNDKSSNI